DRTFSTIGISANAAQDASGIITAAKASVAVLRPKLLIMISFLTSSPPARQRRDGGKRSWRRSQMPMTETPEVLIETPPLAGGAADRVELLSDVLAHVRLSGALYLRGRYSSPWALDSPPSEELVKLLAPG